MTRFQTKRPLLIVIFGATSAFMTYFCMYAFRKPYTIGGYKDIQGWQGEIEFKIALILAQIFGYMLAKFIGVKVIAEMQPNRRATSILCMVLSGWLALLGFALIPAPYSLGCLFINGLSLGMIWGLVFSFLEGRRSTEILGAVLATTFIIASGLVRSVASFLLLKLHVPELWMPFVTGSLFVLPLALSVYGLSLLPAPDAQDIAARAKRQPMNAAARWQFFTTYAPGLLLLIGSFLLITGLRDFRDNFSAELWQALGFGQEPGIFAYAGIRIAFLVLFALAAMVLIKSNRKAFYTNQGFILFGASLMLLATLGFEHQVVTGKSWMVLLGAGLYIAYIPYNCFLFDRMISALQNDKAHQHIAATANAGFLIYLADSAGYLGSVGILLYRTFFYGGADPLAFFIHLAYWVSGLTLALVCTAWLYFYFKLSASRSANTLRIPYETT